MHEVRPYERLSRVYDLGWAGFALQYIGLLEELLRARRLTRARILDLACGTGNLAIELAKRGHEVHGIDNSGEMIALARQKAASSLEVAFDVRDMARLSVGATYHLVTCTFDSLNYLVSPDAVARTLSRVWEVLVEGGLFVFDSNTQRHYLRCAGDSWARDLGGERFLQKTHYDGKTRMARTVFEFSDGKQEIHCQRPYGLEDIEPLLTEAGFRVCEVLAGFDRRPYAPDSDRLICVAEKSPVIE
jgi:2-polyprenyl-3-methyl-5-hydroxy-6-metoxy-1,4-benzoquinol methylase